MILSLITKSIPPLSRWVLKLFLYLHLYLQFCLSLREVQRYGKVGGSGTTMSNNFGLNRSLCESSYHFMSQIYSHVLWITTHFLLWSVWTFIDEGWSREGRSEMIECNLKHNSNHEDHNSLCYERLLFKLCGVTKVGNYNNIFKHIYKRNSTVESTLVFSWSNFILLFSRKSTLELALWVYPSVMIV